MIIKTKNLKVKTISVLFFIALTSMLVLTSVQAEEKNGVLLNAVIKVENDDNVLRKIVPVSDTALKVAPEMHFLSNYGKHRYFLGYKGEYTGYAENSKLNYDDHDISALVHLDHTVTIDSEFSVSYLDKVEDAGSTNSSSLFINKFNHFNKKSAQAKFFYGTYQSSGQLVLKLDHSQQRFTNNFQGYRDTDRNNITGTFFYRIAPKTRLLFESSLVKYDYVNSGILGDQSSEQNLYLSGIEWKLTAKTSGTFKIGYQDKNYQDKNFSDIAGLSYMLDMAWQPNTYTTVKVGASRLTSESAQLDVGGFETTTYKISIDHKFTPLTRLVSGYTQDNDDIISSNNRKDIRKDFNFGLSYSLLSWVDVALNYRYLKRDSDIQLYEYKSNMVDLSFTTTFD